MSDADLTRYETFLRVLCLRADRIGRDILNGKVGDPFPTPTEDWDGPHPEDFA